MSYINNQRIMPIIMIGLALNSALQGAALAQAADPAAMIAQADANDDGSISREEIINMRSEIFAQLDRNGDNIIAADDAPAGPFARRFNTALSNLQAEFDADGSGDITKTEMLDGPTPVFDRGDANGDGVLSPDEIDTLLK